jgi:Zn-dependent protease with chaperone function
VQRLSPVQLEAVLAHELGHHLGGHPWASLLRYWYSLPATYVFQFATHLSLALTRALASGNILISAAIATLVGGSLSNL